MLIERSRSLTHLVLSLKTRLVVDSILKTVIILRSIKASTHMINYSHIAICLGQESLVLAWVLRLEVVRLAERILPQELISIHIEINILTILVPHRALVTHWLTEEGRNLLS